MKKIIILFLIVMPRFLLAQNWTPEEKTILDRVKTGWSSWQDAVNNKDYSIWLKAADPAEDFQGWWLDDGALGNPNDSKKHFDLIIKDIKKYYWINVKPLSIKVYEDVAFIWFYASYATENLKGNITWYEEKRFEAYRKIDGKWRWSAGMTKTKTIDD